MTLAQLSSSQIARPPRLFRPRRKRSARYYRATTTEAKSSSNNDNDDGEKMRKNPDLYSGGDELDDETVHNEQRRTRSKKKPDVLAPAGGWPQLEAAIKNGADCVYFGLELLNARPRANNFTVKERPKVMDFLRERGAKGYVTMNVLIFDDELTECENLIRAVSYTHLRAHET